MGQGKQKGVGSMTYLCVAPNGHFELWSDILIVSIGEPIWLVYQDDNDIIPICVNSSDRKFWDREILEEWHD